MSLGLINNEMPLLPEILDCTENAIIAVDVQGIVTYCNSTVERILEVKRSAIMGKLVTECFPTSGLLQVLKTGEPALAQTLNHGDMVLIGNRNPIFRDGELVGAIAVFQDITLLHNFLDQLEDEHEKIKELQGMLEAVVDSAYEGLIVIDKAGTITMTNQAFANFFNTSPEKLIGRDVHEVYDNPKFPEVLQTGIPVSGYIHNLNGHKIVASRFPIKLNGKLVGALGKVMFKDISDLYLLAEKTNGLQSELDYYKDTLRNVKGVTKTFDQIITVNPKLQQLFETAKKVALNNSTVLIRGESGTGKELIANALHHESSRWQGPFVKVNCAAVPENLLESELFGYVEGAFTGARKGGQSGKFELADKGTIFLDEIGDMPLAMQAKLLRVLQEKEIERLGDHKSRKVDVRVIAATNRNLEELMADKQFREDLYYRLNVISLQVPPLRERTSDISALVEHFISKFNRQFGTRVEGVDDEVLELFRLHGWPGNVRELENVMERAYNLLDGGSIQVRHLPVYLQTVSSGKRGPKASKCTLQGIVEQVEKDVILEALEVAAGNKVQAARALGLSRSGLYKKLEKYQID